MKALLISGSAPERSKSQAYQRMAIETELVTLVDKTINACYMMC